MNNEKKFYIEAKGRADWFKSMDLPGPYSTREEAEAAIRKHMKSGTTMDYRVYTERDVYPAVGRSEEKATIRTIRTTKTDIKLFPQELHYSSVKIVSREPGRVRFVPTSPYNYERRIIEHAGPYTIVETTSMTCGHDLACYYAEDGGNAGEFPGCNQCDLAKATPNEQNTNVL